MKIEIKNIGGIWYILINDSLPKRYNELNDSEKKFFNTFLKEFKTH